MIVYNINIINTQTGEVRVFQNKTLAAHSLGIIKENLNYYLKNNLIYKKKFRIERGEQHERYLKFNMKLDPEMNLELNKILSKVNMSNLRQLTNAICKDYILHLNDYDQTIEYNEEEMLKFSKLINKTKERNNKILAVEAQE